MLSDSTFGLVFELLELDGSENFELNDVVTVDVVSGKSVGGSGGINGDGVSVFIIRVYGEDPIVRIRSLENVIQWRGKPSAMRCGPEYIAQAVLVLG